MADKKVENKDIFDKNLFEPTQSDGEKFLKLIRDINAGIVEVAKQSAKGVQLIDPKTAQGIEDLAKAQKELVDIQKVLKEGMEIESKLSKENIKLQAKLITGAKEQAVVNAKLKIEVQEQNKVVKQQAREQLDLIGAYEKSSKTLIKNRKRLKDLTVEGKQGTKEFKDLTKSVVKLDRELKDVDASVGQFQRNVGNYNEQAAEATQATLGWAVALIGLNGGLGDVTGSLKANEEGSEELRKTQAQLEAVGNSLQNRFSTLALNIFSATKQIISGDKTGLQFLRTLNGIADAFNGVNKEIEANVKAAEDAESAQIKLEKSSRALLERVAVLSGEVERQNAIAGDSTKSFDQIAEAIDKANESDLERISILRTIAAAELKIIRERILATADEANRRELLDELTARRIALIELESTLAVAQIVRDKEAGENARDRFEIELDFTLDIFDAQKTVNERRVADERKTLEERRGILDRTVQLADESFADQIKLTEDFLGKKTDLEELALLDDQRIIRDRVRELSADEKTRTRILEIIKERKFVLQDIADLEKDLGSAISASNEEQIQSTRDRVATINEIEQTQIQGQIDAIERSIDAEEKAGQKRLDLLDKEFQLRRRKLEDQADFEKSLDSTSAEEKELIDAKLKNDLAALDRERLNRIKTVNDEITANEKAAAAERLRIIRSTIDQIVQSITDLIIESSERTIAGLNKDLEAQKERENEKRILAAQGSEDAINNLAFEAKERARIESEIADAEKRAQIAELTNSAVKAFAANLDSGQDPASALGNTIASITALLSFIGGLSSFKDGSEDIGTVAKPLDGHGGRMIIAHDNERIVDKSNNMKIGDLSNDQLANLAQAHNSGALYSGSSYNDRRIVNGLSQINSSVQKNKPIVQSKEWDAERQQMKTILKEERRVRRIIEHGGVR